MASRGYLGKISAVVAINTGGVKPSLNATAKDIQSWGRTVQSRLSGTSDAAKRAFDGIFTPLQKLQAAVKAANRQPLDLKIPNVRSFLDLAKATEQIAKPLGNAQKQLTGLSQGVQSQLLPALVSAQKQASGLFDAIANGARITERDFANTEARINRVVQAIGRANEASQATRGLATGQELRFQNPEFLRSTSRAAQLQQQAAQLSPEAISSRGIVSLIGQQKLAADEAERLRATLERTIATRNGDQESARRAYTQQVAYLDQVNARLERQIQLERQAGEINDNIGASTQLMSTTDPTGRSIQQRIQDTLRLREAEDARARAARESAEADEIAARSAQLRSQAAGQLLNVLQRESQLLSNEGAASTTDATGRSIQQRAQDIRNQTIEENVGAFSRRATNVREYIALLERERQAAEAASEAEAEQQRRREAASRFLRVDQQGSDIASNEGRSTPLTGNRDPRTRVLGQLGQEVGDLRNRLRGVGETLAGDIGPTVDNLTTRFQNMARQGIRVSAEEARRLAQEVAGINAALNNRQSIGQQFESSFGGAGRAGLSLGVDERSLRAIGGQIEFVQGRLSALGQEARGPVIAALDALRTRANQLFQGGALDTEEGRRELQLLREELVRTLAAAGGGNERRIAEQLNRVGDVARGSFGNAGLAIQQAAFAFEDFFSVTGGLDQRIRAAGNNISQLGFILGGTTGLIFGISAAIGSQLIVALINWSNGGRTAEDQTKSLNDALARQKSLVEDLKQAFESLGDAIADRAFSEPAQQARKFARELEDVAKKQKELRESRVADLDEGVQRERANQNRINRELESETDPGRRVALQRRLDASRAAEREAARAAADRRVSGDEVANQVANAVRSVQRSLLGGLTGPSRAQAEREIDAEAERVRRSIPTGGAPQDVLAQRDRIQGLIRDLTPLAEGTPGFFGRGSNVVASRELAALQRTLLALELPLQKALDELSNSILRASQAASLEIESAQADVADAVRRGVPGAALLQQNLDNIAQEMATAQQRLRDAQESDSPDREQQIRLAQRDIDGIRARQDAIAEASRDIRLTSGRGGERTTSALSALQGNERFANEYGGLIARLRAAVDAEMVARLANEKAMQGGTDAEKEAARAAYESAAAVSDMAAAAAEAALAMEQAVGRIRKIGADALSQSERMADEAQQRLNERPTDENRRRRDDAERELIRDRQRVALANNALDRRRTELQQSDPRLVQINDELESVRQERRRLSDDAAKNNTTVDPAEAQRLADREAVLLAEREQRLFSLTEAERRQQDAINQEINARRRLVDFMEEVERRQNPQGDPVRGLDLLERPGERAARELNQQIADATEASRARVAARLDRVDADFAEGIRNAENIEEEMQSVIDWINDIIDDGFLDNPRLAEETRDAIAAELQTLQETRKRLLVDQMRNAAPTIFGLADSVANAVLQGPSRAALQATDVSTVEGSRELTRLLRGDDAARDQANLVELQREANRLLDIIANAPAPVAN